MADVEQKPDESKAYDDANALNQIASIKAQMHSIQPSDSKYDLYHDNKKLLYKFYAKIS